jgi:TctA family transporter
LQRHLPSVQFSSVQRIRPNLRRALLLSRGDWSVFVTRGLSASLLAVAALLLVIVLLPSIKRKREEAFVED